MGQGILFDFDDTLVETTVHFNRSKRRFAERMTVLGFPGEEALEILNEFDIQNVRLCGGFLKEGKTMTMEFSSAVLTIDIKTRSDKYEWEKNW